MSVNAFKMQLKPGMVDEYKRRHDAIWPDLAALLTESGISNYSIFLDEESLTLFAVYQLSHINNRDALPDHPVMRKWWDYMAPLMEVEPDNRPREWPLTPMFHLA